MDLQKCRPYCTYPELLQEYPNIEDVDKIPEWCKLEDDFRSVERNDIYNKLWRLERFHSVEIS